MEKNMKKNIHIYMYIYIYKLSLCCTAEINTTFWMNYTSIKFFKKELMVWDLKGRSEATDIIPEGLHVQTHWGEAVELLSVFPFVLALLSASSFLPNCGPCPPKAALPWDAWTGTHNAHGSTDLSLTFHFPSPPLLLDMHGSELFTCLWGLV